MARNGDVDPADAVGISGIRDVVELEGTLTARVFVVVDERTARRVTIRVRRAALEGAALARFEQRQDRIASLRRRPNIARVLTHGVNTDDLPFAVSEVVEGDTIADLIDRGRRFEVADAIRIGVGAAGALESVARVDIQPGLLGPADVSLDAQGEPVLAGLAVVERASAATVASARPDQIAFLAPELAEGHGATARSDVYALGALLYTLLTGSLPYVNGGITREVLNRIIAGQLPDLRNRGIPAEVAEVVERAMATSPLDRYVDALTFGEACQQAEIALGLASTQMLVKKHAIGSASAASAESVKPVEPSRPEPEVVASPEPQLAPPPPPPPPGPAPAPAPDAGPVPASAPSAMSTSKDEVVFLPPLAPYIQEPQAEDFEVLLHHFDGLVHRWSPGTPEPDDEASRVSPERPTRLDRRAVLVGAGVVAALLLLVGVVARTGGQGSDSPELTTSATVGAVGALDQGFDTMDVTDETGVITAYAPSRWMTTGLPGKLAGDVKMPTLVSATDPDAFVDPQSSFETDGVRITVDPTSTADAAEVSGLLEGFLSSSLSAGGQPIKGYCQKVTRPNAVKIVGYSGLVSILGPCGPAGRALQIAVLVADVGGSVVTFEGHAADAAHLGPLDQMLGSLAVAPL